MMVEEVPEDFIKPGHHFDTGPSLVDLYRLLCIVTADKKLAKLEIQSKVISLLRGEYLDAELLRTLTSSSTALRILFDQRDPRELAFSRTKNCGKLYPEWPKKRGTNVA
jgi:hypothetical protein